MYDIIIVGGGPAGSMAARKLAQQGHQCLLIDQENFPRQKPCGGAITARTLRLFPFLADVMETPNYRQIFHYKDRKEEIILENPEGVAYFNSRSSLDHRLLKLAIESGCEVKEKDKICDFAEFPDHIEVKSVTGETYNGKFLIAADGIHSIIRRKSPFQKYWNSKKQASVVVSELNLSEDEIKACNPQGLTAHLNIGFGDLEGYGWVFPSRNSINMGFGAHTHLFKGKNIREYFNKYVHYCQTKQFLPQTSIPSPMGWIVPTSGPLQKFASCRLLLVGDAAAFVHPMTGEGIIYAIWSGILAAETIHDHLAGDLTLDRIPKFYYQNIMTAFGKELKMLARFQNLAVKQMGLFFKLAQKDQKLYDLLKVILPAEIPFKKLIGKILWRAFLGIIKGNAHNKKEEKK